MKWYSLQQLARAAGIHVTTARKIKQREAVPGGALDGHYAGTGANMVFKRTALVPLFKLLRRRNVR